MFPKSKYFLIQISFNKLIKIIGIEKFLNFLTNFNYLEFNNDKCFQELTNDVIKLNTNEEKPNNLIEFEKSNPRYKKFIYKPNLYFEFLQGFLILILIFYISNFFYKFLLKLNILKVLKI